MAVYHLSDPHFGHRNIHKFRTQFDTALENDEYILDKILSTLCKRDKLFLLGDVCFTKDSLHYLSKIVDVCPNTVIILGNHDNESKDRPNIKELMDYVGNNIFSMVKYKDTWLTHAPLHPSELRGKYNIHGHVHENTVEDSRYFNVSCENIGYTPIEHTKLMEILRSRND